MTIELTPTSAGAGIVSANEGKQKAFNRQKPPPFAIKTILVPTDFSECSRKALNYAVPLAREFGARIVLMHIAEFRYAGSEMDDLELPSIEKQVAAACRQRLKAMAGRKTGKDLRVETVAWVGKTVPGIISAAKSTKADLIVISTHGGSHPRNSALGSTTERVVRHAPCPVLVVREREHEFLSTEALGP